MPKMQNVITVIPDRFSGTASKLLEDARGGGGASINGVRRPTRGIVLKKDSFATLKVIRGNGKPVTLIDAGSKNSGPNNSKRYTDSYTNFLLQSVQEERMEKSQILETFGEPFIFLFGERPRVISFAGTLINTFDFNWQAEWWDNYENYLRGTRCVENDSRVFLSFDNTIVSGYILSASSSNTATDPHTVPFQFQMFITSYANFSKIGDPNANPGEEFGIPKDFNADSLSDGNWRPTLLPNFGKIPELVGPLQLGQGQNLVMPSLESSLKSSLAVVGKQWATIRDTISSAALATSDKLNGGGVRVPIGYQGSMEFEDVPVTLTDPSKINYGKVQYSTFSDNDDEYVNMEDQYRSSQIRFDNVGNVDGMAQENLVNASTEIWKDPSLVQRGDLKGMVIDQQQLGPAANFLAKGEVGMMLVGMNGLHQIPTAASEAVQSGLTRFANALPNPYGVASNSAAVLANPQQSSQALLDAAKNSTNNAQAAKNSAKSNLLTANSGTTAVPGAGPGLYQANKITLETLL